MITEKEKAIAQEYLADKVIKGIWVNSEGELFFDEGLAKASDEDAEFVKKSAVQKEPSTVSDKTDTKDAEAKNAELKEKNLKLLADTELKKENYQVMKSLVKFFDIKTENNTADTLITALTQFKETLNNV